ncbi:MAG: hypothetical protein ABIO86_08585 [Sphingomonas sp.]
MTILDFNGPIGEMSQQQLAEAKAELDAAWAEAIKRANAALEIVAAARMSTSNEDKASYLRMTEAALFAHNRWCDAAGTALEAMDRHFEETALFPSAETGTNLD